MHRQRTEEGPPDRIAGCELLLAGLSLAVLYWIAESLVESLMPALFHGATFTERFFAANDPNEIWMRGTVVALLIGFGGYAQLLVSRRKRVEKAVRELNEDLESRVERRTRELQAVVAKLEDNEQMLRRSEERFRSLVQNASDIIAIFDSEGTIRYESPSLERALGYGPGALVGTNAFEHIHPDDTKAVSESFAELLREAEFRPPIEFRARHMDGSWRYLEAIATNLLDDPSVEGIVVNSRDITERKRMEDKLRRSLDALLTLNEAGRSLGSSLDLEEVGPRLLETMRRVSGLEAAFVYLQNGHQQMRLLHAFGAEESRNWDCRIPDVESARRVVLESMESQVLRLQQPDPDAGELVGLLIPLRVRDQIIGMLEAYGTESLAEKETTEFLGSLGGQAASALENARLYKELEERERQLKDLVGRLLLAQEEERHRVAYNVHDGMTQVALAAHQHLQAFAHYHPPGSAEAREELDLVVKLVRQTVRESRRVISDLRPTALDDFGLATAIRLRLEELRAEGWKASYRETLGGERLPVAVETALFGVAREALTNVRKHAQTTRAHITLERSEQSVRLQVQDWGCGFCVDSLRGGGGPGERVGLSGMRERIALLGGDFKVISRPGSGTTVAVQVPLTILEEDENHGR